MTRLEKYPDLKKRFEELLNVAENVTGEYETADDAEMAVIREIRKTGNQLLTTWASAEEVKKRQKALSENKLAYHSKKNSTGKQRTEQ